MTYKEVTPSNALKSLVKCYWFYENPGLKDIHYTIIPDGCFDLIITTVAGETTASLTGLWKKQVDVSLPGQLKIAAIRFKPLAAEYLLGESVSSLLDTERDENLSQWNLNALDWNSLDQTAMGFDTVLKDRLRLVNAVDPRKEGLFRVLEETQGGLKVDEYSKRVYWTSRQINRYFSGQFGISLKTYCSILRCFASCREIQKCKMFPPGNYYDQSHFIKDVQRFTGSPPSLLQENKNDRFLQLATLEEDYFCRKIK